MQEDAYEITDVLFNPTSRLRYCYIKPILTSLTGLSVYSRKIDNGHEDWVVISPKEETMLTKIYRKIVG